MNVTPLYGESQANTARTLIGGQAIGENRNDLLRQVLVATANKVGASTPTATTLTYAASVVLDFSGADFQTVTLAGDITFTTSNLAAGRSKTVRIIGDGSSRNFTFPGGWIFVGAAAPTALAANKTAILTMTRFGTADANVVAAYSAQP